MRFPPKAGWHRPGIDLGDRQRGLVEGLKGTLKGTLKGMLKLSQGEGDHRGPNEDDGGKN